MILSCLGASTDHFVVFVAETIKFACLVFLEAPANFSSKALKLYLNFHAVWNRIWLVDFCVYIFFQSTRPDTPCEVRRIRRAKDGILVFLAGLKKSRRRARLDKIQARSLLSKWTFAWLSFLYLPSAQFAPRVRTACQLWSHCSCLTQVVESRWSRVLRMKADSRF